jgi:hypothetical protein
MPVIVSKTEGTGRGMACFRLGQASQSLESHERLLQRRRHSADGRFSRALESPSAHREPSAPEAALSGCSPNRRPVLARWGRSCRAEEEPGFEGW